MHSTMKTAILFGLSLFATASIVAQEAVLSSGNDISGAGGSVSYSIGQVVYTTNSGTNGSAAQGVQQPYEISITSITISEVAVSLSVYPNPTSDLLMLRSNMKDNLGLSYQLHSIHTTLIERKAFGKEAELVEMQSLPSAVYILTVYNNNLPIKTFKIIKN